MGFSGNWGRFCLIRPRSCLRSFSTPLACLRNYLASFCSFFFSVSWGLVCVFLISDSCELVGVGQVCGAAEFSLLLVLFLSLHTFFLVLCSALPGLVLLCLDWFCSDESSVCRWVGFTRFCGRKFMSKLEFDVLRGLLE